MIGVRTRGSTKKTETFLNRILTGQIYKDLAVCGAQGVAALQAATPRETGKTADSWRYEVIRAKGGIFGLAFYNDNVVDGSNIAVLIQYGHGTRNGGYVQGRNYINPAIQPVFDRIAESIWKEVKR